MGIDLGRDPRVPRAAVEEGVPGVIAGMVGFRAFFPASRDRAFYGRIFFLDVVDGIGIEEVGSCGFGVETEFLVEHREDVIDDRALILFGEHPDAEVLRFVFVLELLAREAEEREGDLVAIFLVVLLRGLHDQIVEKRRIGDVNGGFETILVRAFLLE